MIKIFLSIIGCIAIISFIVYMFFGCISVFYKVSFTKYGYTIYRSSMFIMILSILTYVILKQKL